VDLVLAACVRPPNRMEAGVVGDEDEHEEAEEPVMLSSSMVEVEPVVPDWSKPAWWPHFGEQRSEEAKSIMKNSVVKAVPTDLQRMGTKSENRSAAV